MLSIDCSQGVWIILSFFKFFRDFEPLSSDEETLRKAEVILSKIALQQPLAIYDTAFSDILDWKLKDWKVSSVAKKRMVNASLSSLWIGSVPPSPSFGAIISEILAKSYSKSVMYIRNISLNPNRSSTLNCYIILVKYPLSRLLLTQSLVFRRVGFSSSEFINSFSKSKVASSAMMNCQMNGTHKI